MGFTPERARRLAKVGDTVEALAGRLADGGGSVEEEMEEEEEEKKEVEVEEEVGVGAKGGAPTPPVAPPPMAAAAAAAPSDAVRPSPTPVFETQRSNLFGTPCTALDRTIGPHAK
jgi:hypothetical protein